MLVDLKRNVHPRRTEKGVFAYILTKDSHPNIVQYVEVGIISFPMTWMVASGFLAFVVLSKNGSKLHFNNGTTALRLNDFIKVDLDILCLSMFGE